MKTLVYQTEYLMDAMRGIVRITNYYSDGTSTSIDLPLMPPVLCKELFF